MLAGQSNKREFSWKEKIGVFMQKVIFLVDMNAFFVGCEMTRNPSLVGNPAAVAGDPQKRTGIILAANYNARAFGVKTAMVIHEAIKLCPDLALVPPDYNFYAQKSDDVMNLLSNYTPVMEQNSIDEAWLDMTGSRVLFGAPLVAAKQIMNEIKDKLGLWCSIGIAENKFLAKMAAEMKKPLGITELWLPEVKNKLWPLPVQEMYGVGFRTVEKLHRLGIKTIGELAGSDLNAIVRELGKAGRDIHLHAHGIDDSPIVAYSRNEVKSIGREKTLPEDITDLEEAKVVLMEFAEDVGMSLRKQDKEGHTVHIILKYSNFSSVTRQTTIPATSITREIYQAGCRLLERHWRRQLPVRLIGISVSGFREHENAAQLSLFEQVLLDVKTDKNKQLDKAMDKIRNKYGAKKIIPATLVKTEKGGK